MNKIVFVLSVLFFSLIILISINYYKIIVVINLNSKELVIKGTSEFEDQISRALALLNEKAPEAHDMVNEYVGKIEQGKRSGMAPYKITPRISLADKTTYYSLTWCASVLAHEAFHSKLYHDYRKKYRWRFWTVPKEVWKSFEAERKCLKHQLEVLKQINASIYEINYVAMGDGTHGDVNGDGKLDRTDYLLRDW